MKAKIIWILIIFLCLALLWFILCTKDSNPSNNSVDITKVNNQSVSSITERKKELGLDYVIVVDRTPKMSRPGKNFSAVFSSNKPEPTIEQLKTLGEIIRDEYKNESFLFLWFWNDSKAATEDTSKYVNVDADTKEGDAEWEIVKDIQSHLIMQYNKNDVTGLNQLKIYPNGLQTTESKDIVKINY